MPVLKVPPRTPDPFASLQRSRRARPRQLNLPNSGASTFRPLGGWTIFGPDVGVTVLDEWDNDRVGYSDWVTGPGGSTPGDPDDSVDPDGPVDPCAESTFNQVDCDAILDQIPLSCELACQKNRLGDAQECYDLCHSEESGEDENEDEEGGVWDPLSQGDWCSDPLGRTLC